jgi:hypothetical protein
MRYAYFLRALVPITLGCALLYARAARAQIPVPIPSVVVTPADVDAHEECVKDNPDCKEGWRWAYYFQRLNNEDLGNITLLQKAMKAIVTADQVKLNEAKSQLPPATANALQKDLNSAKSELESAPKSSLQVQSAISSAAAAVKERRGVWSGVLGFLGKIATYGSLASRITSCVTLVPAL